ncbi:glycine cleavage system protein GcvH [Corynebacterium striatum]|mgnify:FL=1|uniref:glycine cleavage system protein GcvH n=1 Tax=Corynebacterium TaxID=1716 RepID=UPI0006278A7F|nr:MULTISPECIES: glycine cleavage system protein GcvH [Corynebacterium]KKO79608.1 glycine cleavage system protein H [Corynebacterium striatum]MBD0854126.1 glycine cleavage system protein H [Corynebacterium striatum]MDK7885422.1 glycine cleavage system protein GcvH [Corynebacterium striatum]MDK8842488.1 glycine cleavage system protein GcvH [Corynebacterium striatum]NHY12052.1 glycine cleavage system protein GcvH [Corynebacterium striatum]
MANLPADFSYSEDHEWINSSADAATGNTVRIGITSVAADRLGEVVFAELPAVGDTVTAGDTCGEVESTKSVSDLYSPVTGTVTAVNEAVHDDYAVINNDPFGEGWLFEVEVSETGELMTADEYAAANGV